LLENIKLIFIYLLGNIIYLISFLIPKNKNLWVFGAWFGEKYADNSKYLFEYVNKNHPEIRAIWLTNNNETLKIIKDKGYEAYLKNSIKGYLLSFKASKGILSNSIKDIIPYTSGRMEIIQLWHGSPLKKIMMDNTKTNFFQYKLTLNLFPFFKKDYTAKIYIAPSEEVKNRIVSAFKVKDQKVKITGYPRNDVFFSDKRENTSIEHLLNKLKKDNLIGIYMPTFRKNGNLSEIIRNLEQVNSSLECLNTVLLIKLHYQDLKGDITSKMDRIIFIKNEDINQDIYTILPFTDYLITDYSSVYFDYLFLDKPVIFAPIDIDDYLEVDREFYYNYDEVTPGPQARNCNELIKCIEEAINYPDKYKKEREEINKIFNKYNDNKSCERVFKMIVKLKS